MAPERVKEALLGRGFWACCCVQCNKRGWTCKANKECETTWKDTFFTYKSLPCHMMMPSWPPRGESVQKQDVLLWADRDIKEHKRSCIRDLTW